MSKRIMIDAAPLLRVIDRVEATIADLAMIADMNRKTLDDRISTMRDTGMVDLYMADEICCEVLKLHPCMVYPDWFEIETVVEEDKPKKPRELNAGNFEESILFSEQDVAEIRAIAAEGARGHISQLSRRFGVSRYTIRQVIQGHKQARYSEEAMAA